MSWFRLGTGNFPDTGKYPLSNTIPWCLGDPWDDGKSPEPKQVEDGRVVHLRPRREPAEFPGELHEGAVSPAKGKDAGGELHRLGGRG